MFFLTVLTVEEGSMDCELLLRAGRESWESTINEIEVVSKDGGEQQKRNKFRDRFALCSTCAARLKRLVRFLCLHTKAMMPLLYVLLRHTFRENFHPVFICLAAASFTLGIFCLSLKSHFKG